MHLFLLILLICCLSHLGQSANLDFDSWPHGRIQLQDVSIHFRVAGNGPPLLLVHGNPQHSLTWRLVGPLLTDRFTVIAPDNRGMGDSSIPTNGDYSAEAMAGDLKSVLDFLKIDSALVFSHDKGGGPAVALAAQNRNLVKAIGLSEYVLPGYGYEEFWAPTTDWNMNSNWQLATFTVPDLASSLLRGREKELLSWYFFHASYAGAEVIPDDVVDRYVSSIRKPGFLRAMMGPFSAYVVGADRDFFNRTVRPNPLEMPVLALGGEASIAPVSVLEKIWGPVGLNVAYDIVPKAGHWIADENPQWVADRIVSFFGSVGEGVGAVGLSWLDNKVTLP